MADGGNVSCTATKSVPLLAVGDKIRILWPEGQLNGERKKAKVVGVKLSSKNKNGSSYKYELCFYKENDGNTSVATRLGDKSSWHLVSSKNSSKEVNQSKKIPAVVASSDSSQGMAKRRRLNDSLESIPSVPVIHKQQQPTRTALDASSLRFIVAPMVGASELAFRLLCRRYGATLAYTPMMNSDKFATDAEYRAAEFQTTVHDRPLVAHFSANDPKTFLAAARHVESQCDAIDLNLGCPQRIAFSGHFGSYLLNPEDRPLVLSLVRTLADNLSIPVFAKIRLLDTVPDTIELCQQLIEAGVSLIAIHGRYRVNLVGRSGPGARDGAAHLDQIKEVRTAIENYTAKCKGGRKSIPIIANGNVITWDDVVRNQEFTGAEGVMSAEGLLDNPALFNGGQDVDKLQLGFEYLNLAEEYPVKMKSVIFHIRRMCKQELTDFQLMEECVAAESISAVREILQQAQHYRETGSFTFDPQRAKRAKEALDRRKREESKRKDFEARMVRKAKREGKNPDFYLSIGAEAPSEEDLQRLKHAGKEVAFEEWKRRFSQHCFDFHFAMGGCARDRRCAFLHADARLAQHEAVAFG